MNTEQLRAEFEAWHTEKYWTPIFDDELGRFIPTVVQKRWEAYQAGRAALQAQEWEDALIEVLLEACDEWSQYVEVDTAPRTLREHIQLAIDHARRTEGSKDD